MDLLIQNASQIVTCASKGKRFKAGKEQSDIGLIEDSHIYIRNGIIKYIGKDVPAKIVKSRIRKVYAGDMVVMPGFIDSHTHLVFAGDRTNEYSMRVAGKTYEEIAASGGGIINTVDAVRKSSKRELFELAMKRIKNFVRFGVTTMEAKSGYGLDTENEIKMLEVIYALRKTCAVEIFPSFLGAHAVPKDRTKEEYIEEILYEMLPRIAKHKLAEFIDVFCEKNYFTAEETEKILRQGIKFGLIPRFHTNQFHSIGGIDVALKTKAIAVDHLETLNKEEIAKLKGAGIIACLLPGASYFLKMQYPPARELIDNSVPVALATDFNPGTCMTENIQFIMSLAVHEMNMNIEEAINAVTVNAAASLGISGRVGSIEVGKQADLVVLDMPDYRHLFYHLGINPVVNVIKKGKVIYQR
ncbi:MAG: imidazolonepropionase [Ignavibacteria bacterium]|jgi:imidazolonepropionase